MTIDDTIKQLEDWAKGGSMFPVEVAFSAIDHFVAYLKAHPETNLRESTGKALTDTAFELRQWLVADDPDMPDLLAIQTLGLLRYVRGMERVEAGAAEHQLARLGYTLDPEKGVWLPPKGMAKS